MKTKYLVNQDLSILSIEMKLYYLFEGKDRGFGGPLYS